MHVVLLQQRDPAPHQANTPAAGAAHTGALWGVLRPGVRPTRFRNTPCDVQPLANTIAVYLLSSDSELCLLTSPERHAIAGSLHANALDREALRVTCRAPGKAREVRIAALNRNAVVLGLLTVGVILLWRTRALLTLAVAVLLGE